MDAEITFTPPKLAIKIKNDSHSFVFVYIVYTLTNNEWQRPSTRAINANVKPRLTDEEVTWLLLTQDTTSILIDGVYTDELYNTWIKELVQEYYN